MYEYILDILYNINRIQNDDQNMTSKSNQYLQFAEAHKKISEGYKKLAKASEHGIEYKHVPKMGKSASLKKR